MPGMGRTYFRSGPLPDRVTSGHVTDVTSGHVISGHVSSGYVTSGCSTASLHLKCDFVRTHAEWYNTLLTKFSFEIK
jgi:hypothetical protein